MNCPFLMSVPANKPQPFNISLTRGYSTTKYLSLSGFWVNLGILMFLESSILTIFSTRTGTDLTFRTHISVYTFVTAVVRNLIIYGR